mgnify:CR=1 FL=1
MLYTGAELTVEYVWLREDNDLTQEQIAQILGTSQTMYARYERGANELPIRHLIGYGDGSFRGEEEITREQLSAVLGDVGGASPHSSHHTILHGSHSRVAGGPFHLRALGHGQGQGYRVRGGVAV